MTSSQRFKHVITNGRLLLVDVLSVLCSIQAVARSKVSEKAGILAKYDSSFLHAHRRLLHLSHGDYHRFEAYTQSYGLCFDDVVSLIDDIPNTLDVVSRVLVSLGFSGREAFVAHTCLQYYMERNHILFFGHLGNFMSRGIYLDYGGWLHNSAFTSLLFTEPLTLPEYGFVLKCNSNIKCEIFTPLMFISECEVRYAILSKNLLFPASTTIYSFVQYLNDCYIYDSESLPINTETINTDPEASVAL